jgi:hypothetical protein
MFNTKLTALKDALKAIKNQFFTYLKVLLNLLFVTRPPHVLLVTKIIIF